MDGRAASHKPLMPVLHAIFFPRDIFFTFFHFGSFMVVWCWSLWGSGIELGFWGWGFQLIGFGACDVGPSGFFGFGLSI